MNCHKCECEMERGIVETYPFAESGLNVELGNWPVWKCACGVVMPIIPNPEALKSKFIEVLISSKAPLEGDEILFLRKRMGLTGIKLASVLGVSRVEVSRWENDTNDISPFLDFKLRLEAIERLVTDESKKTALKSRILELMHRLYKPEAEARPFQVQSSGELAYA